ncbi:hypothetical protein TrVE_jg5650 [Triparma verrucosa]|uniref:Protein phosphatase 1 regulatory subunit 7 n=1 Tax=Triparma verrucosa TaxID=1606542 RepID=A0A9W7KXW2_9STRA|nr:hypothetical protein TrVE_jg5650 [Triparma verrucosa]
MPSRVLKNANGPITPKSRPNKSLDVSPTDLQDEEEDDPEGENQTDPPESPTSEARKQAFAQNPLVRSVCHENGITPEQFVRSCHRTLSIDIFASKVMGLEGVGYFAGLVSLCVMRQGEIKDLGSSLHELVSLESLWVTDCGLVAIGKETFRYNSNLQSLHLSGNSLSDSNIEEGAFDHLQSLRQLWMNDNKLKTMRPIRKLNSLKSLWLARNQITHITHVQNLSNLTDLNLSDNRIGCFKELLSLGVMHSLRNLALNDPHYGTNPVCQLCNYQTYALYHLLQLSTLDSSTISEDAKTLSQSIYMKKKMYYNMRTKTLKRNATNVAAKASDIYSKSLSSVNVTLNMLLRKRADVEGAIEAEEWRRIGDEEEHKSGRLDTSGDSEDMDPVDEENNSNPNIIRPKSRLTPETEKLLIRKGKALTEAISVLKVHVERVEDLLNLTKEDLMNTAKSTIKRLMLEFDTGGNIRVEEGGPQDVWFNSCRDLVTSRFQISPELKKLGIGGIRVDRITRIHNRFLRGRFETNVRECLENDLEATATEKGGKVPKRMLEYLFYGSPPSLASQTGQKDEILRVAEDGFRTPNEYRGFGFDESIRLFSTVDGADGERVRKVEEETSRGRSEESLEQALTGQILLVKTFVGNRVAVDTDEVKGGDDSSPPCISSGMFSAPTNSAYHLSSSEPVPPGTHQPKTWHVFNQSLALPEYLIDFEYLKVDDTNYDPKQRQSTMEELKASLVNHPPGAVTTPSPQESIDMIPFLFPLSRFSDSLQKSSNAYASTRDSLYSTSLNLPPKIPQRSKLFLMTPEAISGETLGSCVTNLTYLNLHGHCLRKIENLEQCKFLKVLILSFNEISKIEGLASLKNLERLELGFNLIKRTTGLQNLKALKTLELNNNLLNRLEDIETLSSNVPHLKQLDLRSNPLCKAKSYVPKVLNNFTLLQKHDGLQVTDDKRAIIRNVKECGISLDLIKEHGMGMSVGGGDRPGLNSDSDDNWFSKIEDLDVSHRNIQYISNLGNLNNLRRACFSDNEISQIEGLDKCLRIEDLSLENNRILSIDNISHLLRLRKLELGHNRISKIPPLEAYTRLTQLSVESNEIKTLKPLQECISLMELYIGNNEITDLNEINYLKNLPRLIILDVSGNPFENVYEIYRLFIIYRIKKLKVLDGCGVTQSELVQSKNKYCGKLTRETIVDKVGHSFFEHVRELNLCQLKLKDVQVLSGQEFKGLREINLDNNLLVNLSTLSGLVNLSVLRLNYNRVESAGVLGGGEEGGEGTGGIVDLPNLEILHLGYNRVASINNLSLPSFPNLRSLYLQGNDINKVEGLQDCKELRVVCLDKNRIRAFESNSFQGLNKLKDLRIEENGLRSLSNFPVLPSLTVLSVAGNRINDIIELEKLCRVTDVREVSFANNPVTRKQLYRTSCVSMFPNVRIVDGREVSNEERERAMHLMHGSVGGQMMQGSVGVGAQNIVGGFLQQHLVGGLGGEGRNEGSIMMNREQAELEQKQRMLGGKQGSMKGGWRENVGMGAGGGQELLPFPKATVKLTAVNFESFAGLQPSLGFSAQPPTNGGSSRTVWEGGGGGGGGGDGRFQQNASYNLGGAGGRRSLRGGGGGGGSARDFGNNNGNWGRKNSGL